ncbi:MAG: YdcF family protein [Blautia sp.]
MELVFVILGSLCILYFAGIVLYTGLSSLFPCIWAAGGLFFYGMALLLHFREKISFLAAFEIPVFIKYILGLGTGILLILFLTVEGCIFSGMLHEPSENLDYIIVLGAQVNGNRLSNSLLLRLERAEEYLEENPDTKAVLSGGKGKGENISEAQAMYVYLEKQGISRDRLILEDKSVNTNENLKFSLEILDQIEKGKAREKFIGIVTNGFHVYRGVSIGKKQGCTYLEGIPARSNRFLQVNYLVREFFGIIKDKAAGNI